MTPNQRLTQVAAYVKSHLEEMAQAHPDPRHDPVYRWQHTLRVANYGKQLAQAEGADVEAVIAACLLHDVAHFEADPDYRSHGRLSAKISQPLLQSLGYEPPRIDLICHAIAVHVDGDAGYPHPNTLEASCVSDADNLDRFGTFRILLWTVDDIHDYAKLIDKLTQRIPRLEHYLQQNPLETASGRALFARQLILQITVFQALVDESRITTLPLLDRS
ncbi:MAG: HD domain-containing protein [Anaerolineales bacterium]|nr:HD domain-containing protein [Anaerolineales bacterium]